MSFIPEGFEPADDMCHVRPADTPNWTESYAFWAYWEDHYLYRHFQRHPDESGLWRGYATLLGEDRSVIASHSFGREWSERGPGYQQIHATRGEPFETFKVEIDTLGQRSDWQSLREKPLSSLDDNIDLFKADLDFESISETYAHMRGEIAKHSNASWTHFTPCKVKGSVTIGDDIHTIDSIGWRDHSAGVRAFESMATGYMLTGVFPSGRSFMAIGVGTLKEDGSTQFAGMGGVTIDGKLCYATEIEPPEKTCTVPEPYSELGTLRFITEHGESTIRLSTKNQEIPFALLPPNFESIGLPDGLESRLFYHEWRLVAEWDGEVGIGGWEPCLLIE